MITPQQWESLFYLSRSDFKYPDRLVYAVVQGLDTLTGKLIRRPIILSDWRQYDPESPNSQHHEGTAIDTTWPGVNSALVLKTAQELNIFGGVGIYVNEAGVVSFHFDTRPFKSNGQPARWGGKITYPYDTDLEDHIRRTEYVSMDIVVDMIKKKEFLIPLILIGLSFLTYRILNR